jgi:ABC-type transport system involved in multi-copper enzyme maturation permease subunit
VSIEVVDLGPHARARALLSPELRRTVRGRVPLLLAGLLVAAGVASYLVAPAPSEPPLLATLYYYENGSYTVLAYVADAAGHPVSGARVALSEYASPLAFTVTGTSNGSGIATLRLPATPEFNLTVGLAASDPTGGLVSSMVIAPGWPLPPNGTVVQGVNDLVSVQQGTYRTTGSLLAFFAGPNGTLPPSYPLLYGYEQFDTLARGSGPAPIELAPHAAVVSAGRYVSVGSLSTYTQIFPIALVPPAPGFGPDVIFDLLDGAGDLIAYATFTPTQFGPSSSETAATSLAAEALSPLFALIATASLFLGLAGYGLDRSSGHLENLWARPVTLRGLYTTRYLGLLVPLAAGSVGAVAAVDAGLALRFGAALPPGPLALAAATAVAAAAAFLALAFALSETARSLVALVGGVLAVIVLLGFLWTPIASVVLTLLGVPPWASGAPSPSLAGTLLDPALAGPALLPGSVFGLAAATAALATASALAWILLPWAAGWYRAGDAD